MAYIKGTNPSGEWLDWIDGVTNGADTIIGNAGKDTILADGGNDTIKGGGGADWINGEAGRDTVLYGDSNVGVEVNLATCSGKGGTAEGDLIFGVEDVIGSAYDDKLIGNWDDNRLQGGGGSDVIKGGGGFDILEGGLGNDILQLDNFYGQLHGGEGTDTAVFNTTVGMKIDLANETFDFIGPKHMPTHPSHDYYYQITGIEDVAGSEYGDNITGDDEDNLINGRGGHDQLNGGDGDDDLFGETGNDTFYGGYGADTQTGGAGQDTFVFRHNTDSFWIAGKPADVIKDFQHGVDKIDLTEMDIPPANLYIIDGQTIDGQNYSYFGIDGNENGLLDIGEFAVAVKMAPGGTLLMSDFLL